MVIKIKNISIDPDLIPPNEITKQYLYTYLHTLAEEITKLRKQLNSKKGLV